MAEVEPNKFSAKQFCGNCGSAVATRAAECVHCGTAIKSDPVLDVLENGYIPYCRACGVPVAREEALNCTKCGVTPLCQEHFSPSTRSCALCPPVESAEHIGDELPSWPDGPCADQSGTFPCEHCGARLRRGVGFCPNCGAEHAGVDILTAGTVEKELDPAGSGQNGTFGEFLNAGAVDVAGVVAATAAAAPCALSAAVGRCASACPRPRYSYAARDSLSSQPRCSMLRVDTPTPAG